MAIMWLAFYGVRVATVAMHWFGERVSTIEAVFSVWSVRQLYNKISDRTYLSLLNESDKVESPGEFSSWEYKDENGACDLKALIMCNIWSVTQWGRASFCVDIRCQETTSEDGES
jgi:hypothetical protein